MRVYVFYIYTSNCNRVSISHTLQWIACVKLQQEAYVRTQPTCCLQNLRLADTYASLPQVVSASSIDMPGVGCKCTTFPNTDLRIFRVKLSFRTSLKFETELKTIHSSHIAKYISRNFCCFVRLQIPKRTPRCCGLEDTGHSLGRYSLILSRPAEQPRWAGLQLGKPQTRWLLTVA